MRIIDRLRHQALIKNIPLGTSPPKDNPLLKKQLEQTQKDLNLILTKWTFGDTPLKSAQEFLNNFEPWINSQLEKQKELKEFLKSQGVNNLSEVNISESEQLKFYKDNIKIKERVINDYKKEEEVWKNTEQDYLKKIKELEEWSQGQHNRILELEKNKGKSTLSEEDKEKLAEYDELVSDLDEAKRDKKTLEQETLTLNNQLKLKQQEVSNKDKALEKLKKEKDKQEVNHQKQLKEKNGLITTLNQEIKQHKEKYTKQGKLLDNEQLECKRLEEENEKLTEEIRKIKEKGWK